MAIIKKIAIFIGLTFIISFNMLCLEYFRHSIYKTKFADPVCVVNVTIIGLMEVILFKFNYFGKFNTIISTIIILLSFAISQWALKYILFILGLE